ncbi:MAG: tetratricopeptide repeat protein [Thermodesulfovibrionales bacterium]
MRKTPLHIFLIAIVGIIIYSNSLNNSFIWDDKGYITENSSIQNLSNFLSTDGTRYITFLTFALNYSLGGYNTFGYHIFNLIIHILNAILVYWLVVLTFSTPFFQTSVPEPDARQHNHLIALFSGLLFISHPIQTQAVTYISQRFTSLATLFYLLSLVMYIKWRITIQSTESRGQRAENRLHATRYTLYAASIISAILAMKTKEISFTLPFIIVIYEFSFFTVSQNSGFKTSNSKRFLYLLPFLLTLIIIPLSILGPEWGIYKPGESDMVESGLRQDQLKDLTTLSQYSYLLTQFRVIVTYIRLLFFPINQHLLYDYPVFHSFLNPQVFLSFLLLLLIFALGIYLFYRSRFTVHSSRLIAFGILWFFITLSVESSIIPIKHVIFEHRVYLPSIGIIIAFVSGIFYFLQFKSNNSRKLLKINYILLAAIIFSLSVATYQRNNIWKDEINVWKDSAKKAHSMEAHNQLGFAYHNQGHINKAVPEYITALKLKPDSPEIYKVHANLGRAYYELNQLNEAMKEYQTVLKLKSDNTDAHLYLGKIYYKQSRYDEAIREFKASLKPTNDIDKRHLLIGNVYGIHGGNAYNALWEYQPCFADAHFYLGLVYLAQGNSEKAMRKFKVATILKPDFVEAHYSIGNLYQKQGKFNEAIKEYQDVLKLKPDYAEAQKNLKILLQKQNNPR